jgi:hypothetical protein
VKHRWLAAPLALAAAAILAAGCASTPVPAHPPVHAATHASTPPSQQLYDTMSAAGITGMSDDGAQLDMWAHGSCAALGNLLSAYPDYADGVAWGLGVQAMEHTSLGTLTYAQASATIRALVTGYCPQWSVIIPAGG